MYILSRLGRGMEIASSGWIGFGSKSIYGVKCLRGWLVDRDHKRIRGVCVEARSCSFFQVKSSSLFSSFL